MEKSEIEYGLWGRRSKNDAWDFGVLIGEVNVPNRSMSVFLPLVSYFFLQ